MGALRLLTGRSLRSSRRGVLVGVVLVALAAGVALAALAGARRTASAFPRYLAASRASDLAIDVGPIDESSEFTMAQAVDFAERARAIDGVVDDASYIGLEAMYPVVDGELAGGEVVGSLDGRFIDVDRVAVIRGRLPDPTRVDEVFVNEAFAGAYELDVGDRLGLQARGGFGEGDPREAPILGEEQATVVGVGLFPNEVLRDDFDEFPRVLTTPSLTQRYLADVGSYLWQGLTLAPGTSVDQVIGDYQRLVGDDFGVIVKRTDEQTATVQQAIRPVVVAVAVFGLSALLAALMLGLLAGSRLTSAGAADVTTLRSLGLSPAHRGLVVGAPAVVAALAGALGAVGVAAALSPLAPFGAVRAIEARPGVDIDLTVLPLGGLVVAALLVGGALVSARSAGTATRHIPDAPRVVRGVAAIGAPPATVVGAQHALGAGGRRTGVPARSTVLACALSMVTIAAALVFGASVRTLLDDASRYGWTTDMAVSFGGGYVALDPDRAETVARAPGVDALTTVAFAPLAVAERSISAMGIASQHGSPPLTLLAGSLPSRPDEVAFGSASARQLGVGLGDRVEASGGALTVTGLVALPAVGQLTAEHPSMGRGALLTFEGLARRSPFAYPVLAFVDLADPSERERSRVVGLIADAMTDGVPAEAAEAYVDLRPGEIRGLPPATSTLRGLAAVLGLAAVIALVTTLTSSVRRNGRTFATLRALGFDSRQVRASIHWQTGITVVAAVVIGLPIGVVVGKAAWRGFADRLGVASGATVPLGVLALSALVLAAVASLVTVPPSRTAVGASRRTATLHER